MRVGAFFHIPDSPTDVERIWHDATPLPSSVLPVWARGEPPDTYRQVQTHRPPMRTEGETAAYCSEIGELHTAGLIIDTDLDGDGRHRVYVAAPSRWSIGIYIGDSPFERKVIPHLPVNAGVRSRRLSGERGECPTRASSLGLPGKGFRRNHARGADDEQRARCARVGLQ